MAQSEKQQFVTKNLNFFLNTDPVVSNFTAEKPNANCPPSWVLTRKQVTELCEQSYRSGVATGLDLAGLE